VPGCGLVRDFPRGAEIRTEISCKYTRASLDAMLVGSGLVLERWYTDEAPLFALALLRRETVV
jgi:L-histidine N-alpha-methyltransferase